MPELLREITETPYLLMGQLYVPTGLIPASERTPDIYYANDPRSARAALAAFLAYWHLPKQIRARCAPYLNKLICSLSPMAGGRRMEACALKGEDGILMTSPVHLEPSMITNWEQSVIGRQSFRGLYAAVYAINDTSDTEGHLSEGWASHVYEKTAAAPVCPLMEPFHRAVLDHPQDEGALFELFRVLELPDTAERDKLLARMLQEAACSPYTSIPGTLTHELGHLLDRQVLQTIFSMYPELVPKHPSPRWPYPDILFHESAKLRFGEHTHLSYFKDLGEAWAQLIGEALMSHIQARLNEHIPSAPRLEIDGLSNVLCESYEVICDAIEALSREPQPRQIPALLRAPASTL